MSDSTLTGPGPEPTESGWITVESGGDRARLEACVARLRRLYASRYDFRITADDGEWKVDVRHADPADRAPSHAVDAAAPAPRKTAGDPR